MSDGRARIGVTPFAAHLRRRREADVDLRYYARLHRRQSRSRLKDLYFSRAARAYKMMRRARELHQRARHTALSAMLRLTGCTLISKGRPVGSPTTNARLSIVNY